MYPSDLEEIEDLSQAHRDELYDNLIFNGYIDEEGNVLQPDFFALAENAADFKVNTPIAAYSTDVFNLISAQVNKFNEERLILDQEIFSALPLNAMEIDDLMENLKFNEYINSDNVLTNKQELLAQDVKGFKLALPFYPHRHKILNTIKELITEFKSYFYTLTPESLAGIADQIVAEQIYKMIESDYLQDGRLKEDKKAFFLDQDNVEQFTVGSYFTPIDTAVIFSTLGEIIAGYQKYQLITKPLDELDFNLEEREELMDVLETNGYGIEQGKIPEEKVEYFLNSNNALDFTLDKFEDYNKDIFFVLHAIAKEIDASVREISENVKMLAEKQERVVLETLQDAFGIDAEIVKAVCQQVFRDGETIVEEFLIPVFALVNSQDVISAEPNNQKFNLAYRRILQFARLAAKLRLSQEETEVVFHEQDLVEKFPEKLVLPDTIDRFDALLEHPDGVIYIFKDDNYWAYSAETYNLVETKDNTSETKDNKLTSLSDKFAGLTKIDAAFTDKQGTSFIIAGGNCYCNEKGSKRWIEKDRVWGKVKSNFDDPEKVEAAFQDKQGRTYLFAGDQYIRYSGNDYDHVDEGYPLTIAGNWKTELSNAHLPQEFQESIDAAFQGTNDKSYLFKGSKFVCSDNLSIEMDINQTWGKVKNNFKASKKIDAAYADGGNLLVFVGNQVMLYQDSLENDQVKGLEGFPKLIKSHYPNVPSEFADGVDAAFKGEDGKIHLFKDGMVVSFESNQASQASMTVVQVKEQWGVVRNTILESGRVDAAFVSLEGKTYLFSGNQYFQYSGSDYSQVDEGFPRTIAGDWGGLNTVDAAFVLDGKTYLFGKTGAASDHVVYVRYSQNDYTKPDEGYPQEPNDNWWNLPFNLVQEGADFNQIDAVFTSNDHKTYLFSGDKFIYFDHQQRWWSEPQLLSTHWDSIPFASVDAAFMGRDGKTYLFSGSEYVKYSSPNYSKIDDRYPNITNRYWGNVVNNIAKTGNVDAAIVVESREMIDDVEQTTVHTYLFSGNQYFRYKGNHYDAVEEGYPKYIVPSLKDEPRFKNLNVSYENGIDAAFADRRTIYLFKQTEGYVVSETLSKKYDDLGFTQVDCAFIDQGALFVAENATWHRYSSLEGKAIQKTAVEPPRLREVPSKFKTGLDAVLQGIDRNTYLFKGQDCFNVLLNKEYPLAEEWGRERNTIYINNTVDAAFVGRDGKTYLFSGDQYVTYAGDTYIKAEIEDTPKPIQEKWGGLTSVALAFVKDDKTYLFEKADDEGKFRYLCYSTDDYTQPDPGFPQTAEPDFLQIPATYTEEGFNQIDAVLFEADNMFVLSENRYIQFNFTENQWAYPRPLDRIWRGIPLNHDSFARVKTAFTGRDGATYFFADNYYVKYENVKDENNRFTSPALIQEDWGIVHNNFVNNSPDNKIDAACVWQNKITYLVSGDQYVRYSGKDYRYVDEGYPKQIANHLRREAGFENLPEDFEEIVSNRIANGENRIIDAIIANHRTLYIFMGSHCYVVSQTLDAVYDIDIIGNIKNTILQKNQVDAAFVNERGQTFLFSGDQGVRYSDDRYDTVDDGYPQPIATVLTTELGISTMPEMFQYGIDAALRGRDGNLYLFKNEDYLSSAESEPKLIKETWGKVKNNFISHPGAIDAAFVAPDHHLYVFKGDQYIRYHDAEQEFVDAGYPHAIKDNWGNLPINFEESIDGGFVFEGKTYLLKGDDYVRYSDSRYQYIDSIYPQTFKYRWGDWADYRLSDIKAIARFKQLQDGYSNGDYSLTDFLHPEKGLVKDPYKMLAEMFGWDSDDVKWLKRNNGFLGTDNRFEVRFNLEMVIKFVDVFSVTEKMGTSPAKLYTEVWQKMYPPSDLGAAADTLYKLLGLLNS
ncbi:hemopexin repeat-containing protein [Coleofasciculus sp.]|uniref:hemopexin repeat-containing protein n=1 Tax=Coleofasciculus sp. TaxID=3100458 RepID=UPI003A15C80F